MTRLTSRLSPVAYAVNPDIVSPTKALVRDNCHQGFVVSEGGHWLVHSLDLLAPTVAEVDKPPAVPSRVKCTNRCPWSGSESAHDDVPVPLLGGSERVSQKVTGGARRGGWCRF